MSRTRTAPTGHALRSALHFATIAAWVAAIGLGLATAAHAQPADRYLLDRYFPQGVPGYGNEPGVTVQSRARPDYDPQGVRAGSFVIRPQVTESIGYNDNVLGTTNNKGSFVLNNAASISAASDWSRNSVGGLIGFDNSIYPSQSAQNQTNWIAAAGGTYDIGRDQLALAVSHITAHETPTDLDTLAFEQPLAFDINNVHAGYTAQFGRFQVIPTFDYSQLRFTNGSFNGKTINQTYRNSDIILGTVQTRYEFAPLRNAVLEIRGSGVNYVDQTPLVPTSNSTGVSVLVGLDYVASAVWRYRALVGYEQRTLSAPFKNHGSPIAEANVIWTPTGLTTVTGKFVHTIEDASDTTIQGFDYTSARVIVDHEYLRNVLLRGYAGLQNASYIGVNYNQTLYQAGASVSWLINRNIRLTLSYDFTDRQGTNNVNNTNAAAVVNVLTNNGNYIQNLYLLQARFAL